MQFTLQGPFELFSVGGDVSDANVVKFSNDGRLMLVTTTDGHIHVLDSFRGTLVRIVPTFLSSNTFFNCFIFALKGFLCDCSSLSRVHSYSHIMSRLSHATPH